MRDIGRKLTVINTDSSRHKVRPASTNTKNGRGSTSSTASALPKPGYIIDLVLPIIAENYADGIRQLLPESYLYNPSFADNADGWTISEEDSSNRRTRLIISDNKVRLNLQDGGSISQTNEYIKKPGKHKEYTITEKDEGGTAPPEAEIPDESFDPSEELVTDPVEWGAIEEPEKVSGEEEKPDTLYLSFSYICKEPGTLTIGFPESDQTSEEALKVQTIQLEASENIQTVTAQGTWDGKGPFQISLSSGQVEIVSLSLLDKPLEEYRKQTDSYIKQTIENIGKSFDFIKQTIHRITLIQSHINQIYSNDAVLKSILDDHDESIKDLLKKDILLQEQIDKIQTTIVSHDERIKATQSTADSASSTASSAYWEAYSNGQAISSLSGQVSALAGSISSLNDSVSSLSSRVSALESAGTT